MAGFHVKSTVGTYVSTVRLSDRLLDRLPGIAEEERGKPTGIPTVIGAPSTQAAGWVRNVNLVGTT